ncbi:MAG: polysaccharide biosynthesis protein [Oscillospiraceae bacterium]|nr:polysaccharide biosynthesis protein [Oscillospiraceae bacterium]
MLLTISTAGLPLALSKLVSEAQTLGRNNQKKRTFQVAFLTFAIVGAAGSLVMFLFPQQLASFMKNSNAWYAVKALAPAVFFVCCISAFRGYTQGQSRMVPTAISQVLEAASKLLVGLLLVTVLLQCGYHEAKAASGAIFGVTMGTLFSFIFLIFDYFSDRRKETAAAHDIPDSRKEILGQILKLGIPITIGSSVMSIITLVDNQLVMLRLQNAVGFSEKLASWYYGTYFNTMNLYNLPSSFIVPLGVSIIPSVAACLAREDREGISKIVNSAMRITAILSFPAGIGLSVLSGPILQLVYPFKPEEAASGTPLLAVLGIASIFVCMMLVTNSILQAHGKVNIPVLTMLAGGLVKISVNWFLVGNPEINIKGAPIGTMLCFAVIAILNFIFICRLLPKRPSLFQILVKPALAAGIMGLAVWASYGLMHRAVLGILGDGRVLIVNAISVLVAVAVGVAVYAVLVIFLRIISKDDLSLMPKGEKIARILHIK